MTYTVIAYAPGCLEQKERSFGLYDFHYVDLTEQVKKAFDGSGIDVVITRGFGLYQELDRLKDRRDELILLLNGSQAGGLNNKTVRDVVECNSKHENFSYLADLDYGNIDALPKVFLNTRAHKIPENSIAINPSQINSLPEIVKQEFSRMVA